MAGSRLAVVIPCHNEAATLGPVAAGAARHAHVIVVDDRSTDGSREMAARAGAEVVAAQAPGYDGALETGLRHALAAGFDHVVTLDADGEHDPDLVGVFGAKLAAGVPLVCGRRPGPQRAAEHIAAAAGRALYGVDDLLCGMKGYARPVIEGWAASGAPLHVNMAPAVLWRKAGGGFDQVDVTGVPRVGAPRFGRRLKANLAILRALAAALRLRTPAPN